MAANSFAYPATLANPELPMVRVCNKGEKEAFLASCSYLLYECRVKWEDIDKVTIDLPSLSNPNCPCTRILPCYLYLELRFHFSQLWKEILLLGWMIAYDNPKHSLQVPYMNCIIEIQARIIKFYEKHKH
ncbi:unnamed protein product [Malus baccata var. baccata]